MSDMEGRGGSFSLNPQLAAIFDSDRARELHGKLRKVRQTILAEKRESGYFKTCGYFKTLLLGWERITEP